MQGPASVSDADSILDAIPVKETELMADTSGGVKSQQSHWLQSLHECDSFLINGRDHEECWADACVIYLPSCHSKATCYR